MTKFNTTTRIFAPLIAAKAPAHQQKRTERERVWSEMKESMNRTNINNVCHCNHNNSNHDDGNNNNDDSHVITTIWQ